MKTPADITIKKLPSHVYVGRHFGHNYASGISEPYYLVTSPDGWTGLADGNGCVVVPMEFTNIDEQISEKTNTFTAKHQDGSWYAFIINR